MKLTVYRDACCAQDDQCGPLEAEYSMDVDATFAALIDEIIKSRFLQFSSTHNRISGEADGKVLVKIFSPCGPCSRPPEFTVSPSLRAVDVLSERSLSFRFRHA